MFSIFQQQIHAQQIPPGPMPQVPLGPFGQAGQLGLPHASNLLKAPQDLHREDIKVPLGGQSAEERLVSFNFSHISFSLIFDHSLQRSSVSPAEREKYRRSPLDLDNDAKRRKDEKMSHVSGTQSKIFTCFFCV